MHRSVGVNYKDVPGISAVASQLKCCNERFTDRQLRVKLEAYVSKDSNRDLSINSNMNEFKLKVNGKRNFDEVPYSEDAVTISNKITKFKSVYMPSWVKKTKGEHPKKNLFKNLLKTLNLAFCDYDFATVLIEQFIRCSLVTAMDIVSRHFVELAPMSSAKIFTRDVWSEIEDVVGNPVLDPVSSEVLGKTMQGTEIYTYVPDDSDADIDGDPLSPLGNLWAFNFFFCNPNLGKVVFFACSCRQRKFSQISDSDELLRSQNSFYEAWEEQEDDNLGILEESARNPAQVF